MIAINLSKVMIETIDMMKQHNGKMIRWKYGLWTFEGAKIKYYVKSNVDNSNVPIPEWYCDVKTLRALHKRGIIQLNEISSVAFLSTDKEVLVNG